MCMLNLVLPISETNYRDNNTKVIKYVIACSQYRLNIFIYASFLCYHFSRAIEFKIISKVM